ncbi:MAG: chemotaxis protein CheD [Methanoculleaceae archaeon]
MAGVMGCGRMEWTINDEVEIIGIGEYRVGTMTMVAMGLGSCIALIIHDRREKRGGMAHVMLPESRPDPDRPGKFADTAVAVLLEELEKMGSKRHNLDARIIGGAQMFKTSDMLNIGERNAEAVRQHLEERGIAITVCETGGKKGRSVAYYPQNGGTIRVRTADAPWREI